MGDVVKPAATYHSVPNRPPWYPGRQRTVGLFHNRGPAWMTPRRRNPVMRVMTGSPAVYQYGPGLGFSLNPLSLIQKAGSAVVGAVRSVFKGTTVSVPTAVGQIPINASDLPNMIRGSSVNFGPKPTVMDQVNQAVEAVPGGLATIAVGGVIAAILLSRRR